MDKYLVPLETSCVYYDENFLNDTKEADSFYQDLWQNTKWEKTVKINRWVCLQHELQQEGSHDNDDNKDYKYRDAPPPSSSDDNAEGFNDTIRTIKTRVENWYCEKTGMDIKFNVCLLNYYEDGQQRIGWHCDREEIGRSTPIASISLGATRQFLIRAKIHGVHDRASLNLKHGSLVIMENICQQKYVHSIPREPDVAEGRINLTFRVKTKTTKGEQEHVRHDHWLERLVEGAIPQSQPYYYSAGGNDDKGGDSVFGITTNQDVGADHDHDNNLQPDNSRMPYIVTTNLGAECYCAAEMAEVLPDNNIQIVSRPNNLDGFVAVAVCSDNDDNDQDDDNKLNDTTIEAKLLKLRSAQHVLRYHTYFDLQWLVHGDEFPQEPKLVNGELLYQYVKKELVDGNVCIPLLEQTSRTFRVSCNRTGGPHAFRSTDVEYEIGGAISEYYTSCKPKMEDYDVHVRADVVGNKIVIGTQLNVHDLSKDRHFLEYRNKVTIKTNLAYAMVRCAAIQAGACVVDPFCGSGTLLLEAMEVYDKKLKCVGMDVSRRSVEGAQKNARAALGGFDSNNDESSCTFVCSDARGLRRHLDDESVDAILANLPWGIMTGEKQSVADLQTMYEVFLRTAWYVLKDRARIVMLVLRGLQLCRILRKLSGRYRILSVNVVRTTNNLPCIIVIEKLANDELLDSIKGQLSHLNQFVSIDKTIYDAIHNEKIHDEEV